MQTSVRTSISGLLLSLSLCAQVMFFGQNISNGGTCAGNGYAHCEPITINHGQVSGTQASYVLTISDTDANLKTVANGGQVQNSSGFDITFHSAQGCNSLLNWDSLEKYVATTGQIITHVQVGSVNSSTDVTIYRCYGNSGISTFQGGSKGSAWPATYKAVYHVNETSGQHLDATANGNDSTAISAATQGSASGIIDGADLYNTTANRTTMPTTISTLAGNVAYTISGWINLSGTTGSLQGLFRWDTGSGNFGSIYLSTASKMRLDQAGGTCTGTTTITTGAWHYLVSTYAGGGASAALRGFLDGAGEITASCNGGGGAMTTLTAASFGGDPFSQDLDGIMDEVRIADSVLSASRITTDYNNISNPGTFYTVGAQQ